MNNEKTSDGRQAAREYFLALVKDDFTQLGYLTGFLRRQHPDMDSERILDMTKSIVEELLDDEGLYVIDTATEQRVNLSTTEIQRQIEMTFRLTSGAPDVGDGMWFGSRDYV